MGPPMLRAMKLTPSTSDHRATVQPMVLPWAWILPVIAACAVVMTGHMLGGAWLSEPTLGLPAGLWIVLTVGACSWFMSKRDRFAPVDFQTGEDAETASPQRRVTRSTAATRTSALSTASTSTTMSTTASTTQTPTATETAPTEQPATSAAEGIESAYDSAPETSEDPTPSAPTTRLITTWPSDPIRSGTLHALSAFAKLGESPVGETSRTAESIANWLDARTGPTKSLRVGVMLDRSAASRLADDSPSDIDWIAVSGSSATEAMHRLNLDAVLSEAHDATDTLVLRTREHSSREASWFDWSTLRPATYFSIFPLRLDASRVTFPGLLELIDQGQDESLALTRRIVRLAAMLSRTPSRLTLADRLSGRTAIFRRGRHDLVGDAVRDSAWHLGTDRSPAARAAARVASAWATTAPETLSDDERCRITDLALHVAGDEAEIVLRSAAVRLSMLDDQLGIDAIIRADRMLRQRGTFESLDHVKLVQAELEHGTYGPMTLGRVAAGICLACANTPADRIAFLKDDLLDDLRFSQYLVGRDEEHALLINVFRELERNRRADAYGLPAAA